MSMYAVTLGTRTSCCMPTVTLSNFRWNPGNTEACTEPMRTGSPIASEASFSISGA